MLLCCSASGWLWGACLWACSCVCYGGESTDGPISQWKVQALNPSWRVRALAVTQDGGGGQGHRRMKKREEGVGQGQFQWGPRPRGESPTVYPTSQQQQKARGVFGTQLPKFLETALLKGICWAHFWGKFPFWGSWSKGISCVGRQSFLTWRLLGRETVS